MHDQYSLFWLFDHEQDLYSWDCYQSIEPFFEYKREDWFDELEGKLKIFDCKLLIKLRMNV